MPTYLSRTATTSPCVPQHSPMSSFHEIPDDLSVNRRTSSASCDIDISVCVCVCVRACVCVRCSAVCQLLQLVSFPHTKRKSARHTRPRAQSHASCNRAATELRIVRGAPQSHTARPRLHLQMHVAFSRETVSQRKNVIALTKLACVLHK